VNWNRFIKQQLPQGLVVIIPLTLIVTAFLTLQRWQNAQETLFVSIYMKSSVSTFAQIFYDTGNGWNENESVKLPIKKGDDFVILRFPLPNGKIHALRFDPINKEGYFSIKEIKIVDNDNKTMNDVELSKLHPLQHITHVKIENLIFQARTGENQKDPILLLPLTMLSVQRNQLVKVSFFGLIICVSTFFGLQFIFLGACTLNQLGSSIKRETRTNLILLFLSASISAGIGYYIYHYVKIKQSRPQSVFDLDALDDFSWGLYNQNGIRISTYNGPLKLMTDPFTIYKNYPRRKTDSYSINTSGFREGYTSNDSQEIAFLLGGSAAFAWKVQDDDHTFASIVSRLNPKYDLINCGVIGFLSGQELAMMIHYLDDFHPALYILFDGFNDVYDPYLNAYGRQKWPVQRVQIGFNGTFFMIEDRLADYFEQTKEEKQQIISLPAVEPPLHKDELLKKISRTYLSNISKMNAFAKARGAKFIVVFQPELGNKQLKSPEEEKILEHFNAKNYYEEFPQQYKSIIQQAKRMCEEEQIVYIDMNEEPALIENSQTLFIDIVHLNELGNEIIAEIINNLLLQ
jgi:hypothetical protein